jgi:hypothetical protein
MLGWKTTNIAMKTFVFLENIYLCSVIELITYGTMFESSEISLVRIIPADISHFILGNSTILAG